MVVSLPGLDVSPGDLFVSNGVADILNGSNFSGKIMYCVIYLYILLYIYNSCICCLSIGESSLYQFWQNTSDPPVVK